MRDGQISSDSASRVGMLLDAIDRVMEREAKRLQADAERQLEDGTLDPPTPSGSCGVAVHPQLPDELRWRVMVLGSSVEDINFWIRRDDQDGGQWYTLTEIETGTEVGGVEPREACENYFRTDWP